MNELHSNGIWILGCGNVVSSHIFKCVKCRRYRRATEVQQMAEPITPNHILTMKSSVILPPPGEFCKEDLYLNKRCKRVQFLANEFWRRWKLEYLLNLQQRQKWQKTTRNSKVDDIVILQDDSSPRNEWKLARVVEALPSADGKVRKLKLLVNSTTLTNKNLLDHFTLKKNV